MKVEGKTALVTGGGSGIGRATAQRFATEGATVVVADVNADAAAESVARIEKRGGRADWHELDVRDAEAFQSVVDAVSEAYGIDILHNNAGVIHDPTEAWNVDEAERDRLIDVNVKGVWNGCMAAVPYFVEQGSGAIVNTASLAGVNGFPYLAVYSMTKGAVVNLTQSLGAELGPHSVRVNAVCPAIVDTPMARDDSDEEEWAERKERMAENYPLGRLGEPEDVAAAAVFLASDDADWITSQTLVVDGGASVPA